MLVNNGFKRMKSVPVVFVHEERGMSGAVHGDDFVWEGQDKDLDWVLKVMKDKYELKNRGRLGFGPNDVRKIDILGRTVELTDEGITWQGDPRHQKLLEEYFGMDENTKVLTKNGYDDEPDPVGVVVPVAGAVSGGGANAVTARPTFRPFSIVAACLPTAL